MSEQEITYSESVLPAINQFFANHPELPRLQEVWNVITDYVYERKLTATLANFEHAYRVKRIDIEKVLDAIPPKEWKEKVVKPELARRQAEQPEHKSRIPWGVKSYSDWLHNQ